MSKALVAIGISNAPPLAHLDGAISDAESIAAWASGAGFEYVETFIDKSGSAVKVASIYECCKNLLAINRLEKLVIFFSGHGYSPYPGHEVWLLSDWNSDANEAINASTSVQIALRFERPQLSFIADACRTTWNEAQGTAGQVILPKPSVSSSNSQVDQFYATAFGDVSQQYQPAAMRASYGVFSREVLSGLNGAAGIDRNLKRVVTSRSLQDHLRKVVPQACQQIPNAVIQYPATNPQWLEPTDVYAEIVVAPATFPRLNLPDLSALGDIDIEIADDFNAEFRGGHRKRRKRPRPPEQERRPADDAIGIALARSKQNIRSDAGRYDAAVGRESYETGTGLTIVGAGVDVIVLSKNFSELFLENGAQQIRISGHRQKYLEPKAPCTALMCLSGDAWKGYWIVMPVFPGLIGTALIDADGFSSLNYRPAGRPFEVGSDRRGIDTELAEAAALFRRGLLPTPVRMNAIINILRNLKFDNPALAILAAYICQRQADLAQINDMENYPIGGGAYTPYDLLLLSGRRKQKARRKLVGMLPFMSTGWGLLDAAGFDADPRLRRVAPMVAPSLWTMVKPEAGNVLRELVEHG